jgi:hypothetical protein
MWVEGFGIYDNFNKTYFMDNLLGFITFILVKNYFEINIHSIDIVAKEVTSNLCWVSLSLVIIVIDW